MCVLGLEGIEKTEKWDFFEKDADDVTTSDFFREYVMYYIFV